jgi:hypothetical protein
MMPDRVGCPQCRQKLVRRLRAEPWPTPESGPGLPVRHYGADAFAYIAIASAIIGAGVSAYGQYQSAQQQSAAIQYNAALATQQALYQQRVGEFQAAMLERQAAGALTLAEANAAIQEQQAMAAEAAGKVREDAIRRAYERTQSEVRATVGKAGVDTTGSPLLVLMENADTVGQQLGVNDYQTAVDVANARAGAAYSRTEGTLRAGSLSGEAVLARFGGNAASAAALSQANLLNYRASGIRTAAGINVGTTLLGGFSNAASPFLTARYGNLASAPSGAAAFPGYRMPRFT